MDFKTGIKMGEEGRHFDLLMSAGGEVMLAFDATPIKPVNPVFVYDGRSRGFLCKTQEEKIPFSPLPKEVWKPMGQAKWILCVELLNQHIVAQYNAALEVRCNG